MEKQGIITGIGNTITPEIDAVINNYVVGKNTILKGLELNDGVLSAGVCHLCGYRGVLDESVQIDTNVGGESFLIYGKFVINFDENIEDSFSIYTSGTQIKQNVNPTSITTAGTYYLLLYEKELSGDIQLKVDTERYPSRAYISDRTDYLQENGVIDETATTPSDKVNNVVAVNLHETQPKRVANTEYVHKQIQEELDEEIISGDLMSSSTKIGTYTFIHRAKVVAIKISKLKEVEGAFNINKFIPDKYLPREDIYVACTQEYGSSGRIVLFKMKTDGTLTFQSGIIGLGGKDLLQEVTIGYALFTI